MNTIARQSEGVLLPRGLLLLSAIWLISSWLVSVGVSPPVLPNAASYTPAVRWMVLHVGLGMMVAWPMFRLSGRWSGPPAVIVLLDLIVLISLMHVVIWPLRLVTSWQPIRVVAITSHLAVWTVMIGSLIALGLRLTSTGRSIVMILCMLVTGGGPALAASLAGHVPDLVERTSPLLRLYILMGVDSGRLLEGVWMDSVSVGLSGALALIGISLLPAQTTPDFPEPDPPRSCDILDQGGDPSG